MAQVNFLALKLSAERAPNGLMCAIECLEIHAEPRKLPAEPGGGQPLDVVYELKAADFNEGWLRRMLEIGIPLTGSAVRQLEAHFKEHAVAYLY
ncbi:MAG: hypothetical protein AAFV45_15040 [Pseudomonadota bacterium]